MLASRTSTTTATMWPPLSMAEPHVCAPIDANGNLTGDGARTFEWDARNQLLAVNLGTHRSEFSYDGEQRRVRVVEKENSVVQSDTKVLWCEMAICEERAADGVTVTRRPFTLSEHVAGVARFFGVDHLGSVGDVTDTTSAVVGRYAFDPWGRRTLTAGIDVTSVGFTGHQRHAASGLSLTWYRGYDAELGRWISEDPLRLDAGPNMYGYVNGRVTNSRDPLGLTPVVFVWVGRALLVYSIYQTAKFCRDAFLCNKATTLCQAEAPECARKLGDQIISHPDEWNQRLRTCFAKNPNCRLAEAACPAVLKFLLNRAPRLFAPPEL